MPENPPLGAARTRPDVQSLIDGGPAGRKVLDDYAKAIKKMRQLDPAPGVPADPRSWRYQAAMHQITGLTQQQHDDLLFGRCEHSSWFFLLWHRSYLYWFEKMIQFHLQDPTWSLPYWDYTKTDVGDDARVLPEPFRTPTTGNELFTDKRRPSVNRATNPRPLDPTETDALEALAVGIFSVPSTSVDLSFGGAQKTPGIPGALGAIEGVPHGTVHTGVGGLNPPGWMSRFETAGLDPIFWLHHANIDRLLDVWIGVWGKSALPTNANWLDTKFPFFDTDGTKKSKTLRDTLVSSTLGYVYESTDPPKGFAPPVGAPGGGAPLAPPQEVPAMADPSLLGATADVAFAAAAPTEVALEQPAPTPALAGGAAEPQRWLLRLENIRGTTPTAPTYGVYVNVPADASPADHPELRAGTIPAFGIPEASVGDANESTVGLTNVFDITKVVDALRADHDWDGSTIAVTIVPTGDADAAGDDVKAGRVSVYAG